MYKEINGHEMEVVFARDQGGAIKEFVFWCHTCDDEGRNTTAFDYDGDTEVVYRVDDFAVQHATTG